MAYPIYSIKDENTDKRYFQIWDTFSGYPLTVPMCILTFLQYWGLNDKEKIRVLYSNYAKLIQNGTTLKESTFNNLPATFRQQTFDYIALNVDPLSEEELNLNLKLEELFNQDLSFSKFYKVYSELINGILHYPKRPTHYYLSWAHTIDILNTDDQRVICLVDEIFKRFDIPISSGQDNKLMYKLDAWFKNNLFQDFLQAMGELFYQLGVNNLIRLDAIPHCLRGNNNIKSLYQDFEMTNLLPDSAIQYDIYDKTPLQWVKIDDLTSILQFSNFLSFSYPDGENLQGVRLLELNKAELLKLLSNKVYTYVSEIVNCKDKNNNYYLPMMYTSLFDFDANTELVLLDLFDMQNHHIFHKKGYLIDDGGYYDFHFVDSYTGYLQYKNGLSWVRWSYDKVTRQIDKHPVSVKNPYDGDIWETIEKQMKNNIAKK